MAEHSPPSFRPVTRIFQMDERLSLAPRKWPTQNRSTATVDAILEATAQLLESGRRVSTNAIAERAGVSIGTLYQYFDDKAAVVAALSRKVRESLVIAVHQAAVAAQVEPLRVGVLMIVAAALTGDRRRPRLGKALDQLEAELPLDADHATVQAALRDSLADYLAVRCQSTTARAEALAEDMCAVTLALTDAARGRGENIDDRLIARVSNSLIALIE